MGAADEDDLARGGDVPGRPTADAGEPVVVGDGVAVELTVDGDRDAGEPAVDDADGTADDGDEDEDDDRATDDAPGPCR